MDVYKELSSSFQGSPQKKMLFNKITSQTKSRFESLREKIRDSDIMIIDNNYDLWATLSHVEHGGNEYVFSNLKVSGEVEGEEAYLSAEDAVEAQLEFFDIARSINPSIEIFYFNYPVSGFEFRARSLDVERVRKAREINKYIANTVGENADRLKNVTFVGCVDLPCSLISTKGPLYFSDEVYFYFSRVISDKLSGNADNAFFWSYDELVDNAKVRFEVNPYENLQQRQYWKPSVAEVYPLAIENVYQKKFDITLDDAVATCGSCFAQHIGKRLYRKGYNYLDLEPAPREMSSGTSKNFGYGIYSARYGNVYTSRQLLQLFQRAFGQVKFDEVWVNDVGNFVDPFRPNLCGHGHSDKEQVLAEQNQHLENVRKMFESLDVFVFTMGLTETWVNGKTGAAYPICPGVTAGVFDHNSHKFINLDYSKILDEMELFLKLLYEINPSAKVLLTVSPVPLTATAEERHVLISTMASKSILRAVADQLYHKYAQVDYFPSYDIIMSPPFRGMFFKNNMRNIHEQGVDFVMSHFFSEHHLDKSHINVSGVDQFDGGAVGFDGSSVDDDEAFCDEVFLDIKRRH